MKKENLNLVYEIGRKIDELSEASKNGAIRFTLYPSIFTEEEKNLINTKCSEMKAFTDALIEKKINRLNEELREL
jgi:hypothetical protein